MSGEAPVLPMKAIRPAFSDLQNQALNSHLSENKRGQQKGIFLDAPHGADGNRQFREPSCWLFYRFMTESDNLKNLNARQGALAWRKRQALLNSLGNCVKRPKLGNRAQDTSMPGNSPKKAG
jgi:hypothetical protein